MSRLNLILLPSVLTLAVPGWADANPGPKKSPSALPRPLNLSLPRDVLNGAGAARTADETVQRNLRAPAEAPGGRDISSRPPTLPYGAGYEHRHHETGAIGAGTAGGSAHGAGTPGRRR